MVESNILLSFCNAITGTWRFTEVYAYRISSTVPGFFISHRALVTEPCLREIVSLTDNAQKGI
jgi:hypothetical protein